MVTMIPLLNKKRFNRGRNLVLNLKLLLILIFVAAFVLQEAKAQSSEPSQYVLRVKSDPNILFIGGGGLYDEGTSVTLNLAPETWREYTFIGWKVDGIWTDENPPIIRMDRNHEVKAIYEKSISGEIFIDTIPRVTEITIDGTIYLPAELPVSFDWDSGSEHTITVPQTVKESPNTRFIFDSWKDNYPTSSRTVLVNSEDNEFIVLFKTQHFLKTLTDVGNIIGGGWQDEGTTVPFEVESDIVPDKKKENIRYIFNSWNLGDYENSPSNKIDFSSPTTVKASWDVQYKLDLQTDVPGYELYGTGWYDEGREVILIAEEELESDDANTRYVFERWVSKGSNPLILPNAQEPTTTITLSQPYTIEAKYAKSYRVNVWTQYGSTVGAGFYKQGEVAEIKMAQTEVVVQANKIRKVFDGWNSFGSRTMNLAEDPDLDLRDVGAMGNQNLLLFVDKPTNVTTNWKTQFFLDVQTTQGKSKGSGWYDIGRMVPISVTSPTTPPGMWSTYKFDSWTGDIEGTSMNERVIMSEPRTVIAEWREDNTPGIINALILAGVGSFAAVVLIKTRKNSLLNNNGKKEIKDKAQAFEKFFSFRKNGAPSKELTPSFMEKKGKGLSILDWLLGR